MLIADQARQLLEPWKEALVLVDFSKCALRANLAELPGPVRVEIATHFYWHYPKLFRAVELLEIAGVEKYLFRWCVQRTGPEITATCFRCGQTFDARHAKSRSDLAQRRVGECAKCRDMRVEESRRKEREDKEATRLEVERLRRLPYRQYLRSDWWMLVKRQKKKRAGFRCEMCSSSKNLEVHHKTYENRGNEHWEDLIVLCLICHERHHSKPPPEIP